MSDLIPKQSEKFKFLKNFVLPKSDPKNEISKFFENCVSKKFKFFGLVLSTRIFRNLRVVQTQGILFLKSMSEIDGSDINRLRNGITNCQIDSKSIDAENSGSFYVASASFRH